MTAAKDVMLVVLVAALAFVMGFRWAELQAEGRAPEACDVYEDGSATCPDSTFDWDGTP